jgi:hypothetical protein
MYKRVQAKDLISVLSKLGGGQHTVLVDKHHIKVSHIPSDIGGVGFLKIHVDTNIGARYTNMEVQCMWGQMMVEVPLREVTPEILWRAAHDSVLTYEVVFRAKREGCTPHTYLVKCVTSGNGDMHLRDPATKALLATIHSPEAFSRMFDGYVFEEVTDERG